MNAVPSLFTLLLGATVATAVAAVDVVVDPPAVPVGGVAVVRVDARSATGAFHGRRLAFFRDRDASVALLGVDLDDPPGRYPLRVRMPGGSVSTEVEVVARSFPEERLTVPKAYVELDRKTLARVKREQRLLARTFAASAPERHWRGPFEPPADGPAGSAFGLRRFFNGEPRSPHAGIDFRAPLGAPVAASNRGRVVLARELYFTGNTVVVDHGLGLFTTYVHLSRIAVRPGTMVEKGGRLGDVGATGRATGPHLHFATRIGEARVDPAALLGRSLDGASE